MKSCLYSRGVRKSSEITGGQKIPCIVFNSVKKRTRVVGLFPSEESPLRLVTGVLIEISATWKTGKTNHLQKKSSATFTEKNLRSPPASATPATM
ncbi:MAG: transposase [Akkermansiaceae bacterium]|nr:transposase [Akkermansiaceae bacterium]